MPNHFHAIIWIQDDTGTARRAPTAEGLARPVVSSLSSIVRSFKAATTRAIRLSSGKRDIRVWQRGFHEHVIRGGKDLEALREYIVNNPLQWALDSENPANVKR